jgi:hypothetical protein
LRPPRPLAERLAAFFAGALRAVPELDPRDDEEAPVREDPDERPGLAALRADAEREPEDLDDESPDERDARDPPDSRDAREPPGSRDPREPPEPPESRDPREPPPELRDALDERPEAELLGDGERLDPPEPFELCSLRPLPEARDPLRDARAGRRGGSGSSSSSGSSWPSLSSASSTTPWSSLSSSGSSGSSSSRPPPDSRALAPSLMRLVAMLMPLLAADMTAERLTSASRPRSSSNSGWVRTSSSPCPSSEPPPFNLRPAT